MFFTTHDLRRMGYTERPAYWFPAIDANSPAHIEHERRRGGRTMYYVDDDGMPVPEGDQ